MQTANWIVDALTVVARAAAETAHAGNVTGAPPRDV